MLKGEIVNVGFIPFEKLLTLGGGAVENLKADSIADKLLEKVEQDPKIAAVDTIVPSDLFTISKTNGRGALDDFFAALNFETSEKVVRIAHYGDSQIEGDRITCNLRNKFVAEFGGEGVGFVPFEDIASSVSYTRNSSDNWKRFTVFRDKLKNGSFGLSGMAFVYHERKSAPAESDSLEEPKVVETKVKQGATVSLRLRNKYSKVTIQYGNAVSPCKVVVRKSGTDNVLGKTVLDINEPFVEQVIDFSSNEKNITFSFSGESPLIYGINIDGTKGISVDNFGIRGHSGNGLLKIEKSLLAKEIKQSNTRLVILQFGANTIPGVTSKKMLDYVAKEFSRLFNKFKQANDDLSILVIGVGDMATKIDGEYTSYPMIPDIRDAIKNAALESGCAYFDLYEFMGGKDAILAWSKKGLASKDGHFSPRGQQIVADEIFKSLNDEFKLFKKKHQIHA